MGNWKEVIQALGVDVQVLYGRIANVDYPGEVLVIGEGVGRGETSTDAKLFGDPMVLHGQSYPLLVESVQQHSLNKTRWI
jgi:hypothetical protein